MLRVVWYIWKHIEQHIAVWAVVLILIASNTWLQIVYSFVGLAFSLLGDICFENCLPDRWSRVGDSPGWPLQQFTCRQIFVTIIVLQRVCTTEDNFISFIYFAVHSNIWHRIPMRACSKSWITYSFSSSAERIYAPPPPRGNLWCVSEMDNHTDLLFQLHK
jgi:hypothetical protein